MSPKQLFEQLLQNRSEGTIIDFKSGIYSLNHPDKNQKDMHRVSFIKDVLAMANTPRMGASYIVLGVQNTNEGGVFKNKKLGVKRTIDDNLYQQELQTYIHPCPPQLRTVIVEDEGKIFVILEIGNFRPSDGPFTSKLVDKAKLKTNTIYYRSGSSNTEAKSNAEKQRILEWFHDGSRENRRSWEMFLEAMHGFERGRTYILVTAPIDKVSSVDIQALAHLPFFAVFDFDSQTNIEGGMYQTVKDQLQQLRSLHLYTPKDNVNIIQGNSTYWFAVSGLMQGSSKLFRKQWISRFKYGVDRQINELGSAVNPTPVTCLILCYTFDFSTDLFEPLLDQITAVFGETLDFLFVSETGISLQGLADQYSASALNMPFTAISAGINEHSSAKNPIEENAFSLPGQFGAPVKLQAQFAKWIEEHLEPLYLSTGLQGQSDDTLREFLRGAEITWSELDLRYDAERDKTRSIVSRVKTLLEQRDTTRVQIFYPSGSGGTTVAKRVIWDLHTEFPCAVLKIADGADTIARMDHIREITNLSMVILIDTATILRHEIDELRDMAQSNGLPVVFIVVERLIHQNRIQDLSNRFTLDKMLTNVEISRFYERFLPYVPNLQAKRALEELSKSNRGSQHNAFTFGFTAFGKDYKRIEQYISQRLENLTENQKSILGFVAFAHYFGRSSINGQSFASLLSIPKSRIANLAQAFGNSPDTLELLINEGDNYWRTSNDLLEEEIIKQLLWPESSNRDNWRQKLSEWLIKFITFCRGDEPLYSRDLRDVLTAVIVNRGNDSELGTERAGSNDFAMSIEMIPSPEGQYEVLRVLADSFPEEAHFQAHLGRFLSIRMRDFDKASEVIQRAIAQQPDDFVLHHMLGMAYRAKVYQLIETKTNLGIIEQVAKSAKDAFIECRNVNPENEHGYISEAQMLVRLMDYAGREYKGGFIEYISRPSASAFMRDTYDEVEHLLERVRQNREGGGSSNHERDTRARLDAVLNRHDRALEVWDNLRGRSEMYLPGINRKIIHTYLAQHERVWSNLPTQKLTRIVSLLNENLNAEPYNERDLSMWIKAIRLVPSPPTIESIIEKVGYWKTNSHMSIEATYYLYVHYALLALEGSAYALDQTIRYMEEVQQLTRTRKNRFMSLEWLAAEDKRIPLINKSELGEWDDVKDFWNGATKLKKVRGLIVSIKHGGQGIIDLNGMPVNFSPSKGGFVRDKSERELVEFYLGFSYNGPYAWSIHPV